MHWLHVRRRVKFQLATLTLDTLHGPGTAVPLAFIGHGTVPCQMNECQLVSDSSRHYCGH